MIVSRNPILHPSDVVIFSDTRQMKITSIRNDILVVFDFFLLLYSLVQSSETGVIREGLGLDLVLVMPMRSVGLEGHNGETGVKPTSVFTVDAMAVDVWVVEMGREIEISCGVGRRRTGVLYPELQDKKEAPVASWYLCRGIYVKKILEIRFYGYRTIVTGGVGRQWVAEAMDDGRMMGTQGFYVVRIRCKSYVHGLQLEFILTYKDYKLVTPSQPFSLSIVAHISPYIVSLFIYAKKVSQEQAKLSPISLIAAAPHHHLEGPVEAPTSSNSAVADPATDSSSVSTGLDTPPDPEIHRGPLTLSKHSKHPTGENFPVLVFKTQRLFVTVPGTHPVLPLSQNLLTGLDFPTRSTNIPLAPEFMFAK
ncbi:hypothetical protein LXL04_024419 [Taraxacum kok-saghyz]